MRFRWSEENSRRRDFFMKEGVVSIASGAGASSWGFSLGQPVSVPVELIHSQVVFAVEEDETGLPKLLERAGSHPEAEDLRRGDGLITRCSGLVPVVTVADCLPIYLYHQATGCRGVVHSGWKGTVHKIGEKTVSMMEEKMGCRRKDILAVIGPSICQDCYDFFSHFFIFSVLIIEFRVWYTVLWSSCCGSCLYTVAVDFKLTALHISLTEGAYPFVSTSF